MVGRKSLIRFFTLYAISVVILTVVFVMSTPCSFNITNCANVCDAQAIMAIISVNIRFIYEKFSCKDKKKSCNVQCFFEKSVIFVLDKISLI